MPFRITSVKKLDYATFDANTHSLLIRFDRIGINARLVIILFPSIARKYATLLCAKALWIIAILSSRNACDSTSLEST